MTRTEFLTVTSWSSSHEPRNVLQFREHIVMENFTPSKNSRDSHDSESFGICIPICPRSTTTTRPVEFS